jgi:hypothetical protein
VGLIAREIESRGVPTLSLSSAYSITRSVNPPRAVFLDFPLGHTAGRPRDPKMQDAIIEAALAAFETLESPGQIHRPAIHWDADDAWKNASDSRDDRTERSGSPQYQLDADRVAAEGAKSGQDREL